MELVPVHKADKSCGIAEECCDILNHEWPRSRSLRMRSVTSSRDELPAVFALVQSFQGDGSRVLGTSRMTRIPSDPLAVWIESVVVHPELRGKGVGKYLMLKTEQFAREELGFETAYLCTVDQQLFYSRQGC